MSNPSTTAELFTLESVVRGHHIYKRVWTPMLGEKLQIEIDFNLLRKFYFCESINCEVLKSSQFAFNRYSQLKPDLRYWSVGIGTGMWVVVLEYDNSHYHIGIGIIWVVVFEHDIGVWELVLEHG